MKPVLRPVAALAFLAGAFIFGLLGIGVGMEVAPGHA